MSLKTFIGSLLLSVVAIFHKVTQVGDVILSTADTIVNEVKKLQSSEVVQFLEKELIALLPPELAAAANAVILWLPNALGKIANISDDITTDEAKVQAFLDYLIKLENDPTLYAGTLVTLNADAQQLLKQFVENPEAITLTPQMSLVAAPVQHDPSLAVAA